MYFSTVVAFAVLPFLVRAVPVSLNSPRIVGLKSIPLSRGENHLNGDGSVDLENLHAVVHHTMAFVFLCPFVRSWTLNGPFT